MGQVHRFMEATEFPRHKTKKFMFLLFVKQKKRKRHTEKHHGLVCKVFTSVCGDDLNFAYFAGFIYEA